MASEKIPALKENPLALNILMRLARYGPDYVALMSKGLKRPKEDIAEALGLLVGLSLVERQKSGIIKKKHRKIKPKKETKPHHTYYVATREGDHLVRELKTETKG